MTESPQQQHQQQQQQRHQTHRRAGPYKKLGSFRAQGDVGDASSNANIGLASPYYASPNRLLAENVATSSMTSSQRQRQNQQSQHNMRRVLRLLVVLGILALIAIIAGAAIGISDASKSTRDGNQEQDVIGTPTQNKHNESDDGDLIDASSSSVDSVDEARQTQPPSVFTTDSSDDESEPSNDGRPRPGDPPSDRVNAPSAQSTVSPIGVIPSRNSTQPSLSPTLAPTPTPITYQPGNLTTFQEGLLLSHGLSARRIASSGAPVPFHNGSYSTIPFHGRPDGSATFVDDRPHNPGGWIYVSNSEMLEPKAGGVGAITFDHAGRAVDYARILTGTTRNCAGGRTPWQTWASCEEVESEGQIYQVDPTGQRQPQLLTLGSDGGRWEAFAYDVRDRQRPYFFATEDHTKGTVRRFVPHAEYIHWEKDPWTMLHSPGTIEYLVLYPNATRDGGTFAWTQDIEVGRNNARSVYPQTEGIDVRDNEMYFVCKGIRQLFGLDLDEGTYWNHTTVTGLFDGSADQIQRVVGSSEDLLYFTEQGGKDAGIHARDATGRFYTILESPVYADETTGLAFSPDGMHMYVAYQGNGLLFDVWREDGQPFPARTLDVKYHATSVFGD